MNEIQELLYQELLELENEIKITINKTEIFKIDKERLNNCETDIKERLKVKLKTGSCSSVLIEQLSFHQANYGERFGDKIEFFNTSEILQLIENLENKKIDGLPFNNEPLKPYLHIHLSPYSSLGYSIIRNIREYWFDYNRKIKRNKIDNFKKILQTHITLNLVKLKMHQIAMNNKDLKGEWLIYKLINGKKIYLCLASHREGKNRKESDENIFDKKIRKCLIEFPELS